MLDKDKVLITTGQGAVEAIVPRQDAGDDILQLEGILSPGFINCHCHLELSHLKGAIPEKTGLIDFVWNVIRNRHYAGEEILQAIEKAEQEMLQNGIVAVGDICNNTLTAPQKTKGNLRYHNFIEASGFVNANAPARFQQAVDIYNTFSQGSAFNSIVPHAPYSVAEELWKRIIGFPGNQLLTIHNQETIPENELFMQKQGGFLPFYEKMNIDISWFTASGKTSLQTCLPNFLPGQEVILVHNVYTSREDVLFSKQPPHPSCYWCLCPNANLYITGQLPDIQMMMEEQCEIVLGTDSLASNHQLSVLAEMKSIQQQFPSIPLQQLFSWATLNGAKALKADDVLGSFEKGKKPGIVICEEDLEGCRRLL
jgi:cytosine/adenosine deaminase-related metal-dependent hydrolase